MSDAQTPRVARNEVDIFNDLEELCAHAGFAEALAQICCGANVVLFKGSLTGEALAALYDQKRLIRTEISVLVGLLARLAVDESLPTIDESRAMIARAEELFEELHDVLGAPWKDQLRAMFDGIGNNADLDSGAVLREPFFYSGESAHSSQYRDFTSERYASDDDWIKKNRGFRIALARDVAKAVIELQTRKVTAILAQREGVEDEAGAFLPALIFTLDELATEMKVSPDRVGPVLEAFSLQPGGGNPRFQGVQDFNETNATPLLTLSGGRYLLFQPYSLCEALYESPTFWMLSDKEYWSARGQPNRGAFTEQFAAARLRGVFGRSAVHTNVEVAGSRGARRGEIDVLVVFGDHAIVIQAKSKRLTLEARRGSDGHIRKDFQAAIQAASDQALDCAAALMAGVELRKADGSPLALPKIRKVFPLCVVADHYPALAAQVRRFLKATPASGVAPPLVADLFSLDTLTEMLGSPLHLLSYLDLRARFAERLAFNHEFTLLGVHVKHGLWFDDDADQIFLDDSLGADLDASISVRRDGLPGPRTPAGLLTRTANTSLTRLIGQLEQRPAAAALGITLLQFGEDSHRAISTALDRMYDLARRDAKLHDFGVPLPDGGGLTIHVNPRINAAAADRLEVHCSAKKYQQRADTWDGLLLSPDGRLQTAIHLDEPWSFDAGLEAATATMQSAPVAREAFLISGRKEPKPHLPCPCGSGMKFKKCCRLRQLGR